MLFWASAEVADAEFELRKTSLSAFMSGLFGFGLCKGQSFWVFSGVLFAVNLRKF
jgi:hypothetical protein